LSTLPASNFNVYSTNLKTIKIEERSDKSSKLLDHVTTSSNRHYKLCTRNAHMTVLFYKYTTNFQTMFNFPDLSVHVTECVLNISETISHPGWLNTP